MTCNSPLRKLIGPAILAISAVTALGSDCGAVYYDSLSYGSGYYLNGHCLKVHPCAPLYSALNAPLRPYWVPRQPGLGGQEFCYRVAPPIECPVCGTNPANDSGGAGCTGGQPLPPELEQVFAPLEFEHLGEIPNDSLLQGAGPSSAAR